MPDIDELLTNTRFEAPTTGRSLDDIIAEAHGVARRRRAVVVGAVATVAIAGTGALVYAGTAGRNPSSPGPAATRLAAYDHVVGADPDHSGRNLVVGPADEHTANCNKVPGASVTTHRGPGGSISGTVSIPGTGSYQIYAGPLPGEHVPPMSLAPNYVFSCPAR